MNCDQFTKTKKVGKCGTKVWLGTATTTGTEDLFVRYQINNDEVVIVTTPIIQGNDIFLDLTDPYVDFYHPYATYFIYLSDANGYYEEGITITNGGLVHEGFIVNFSNAPTDNDRLIVIND